MTIIAAARYEGRVVMGCDALATDTSFVFRGRSKIHRVGGGLLGGAGWHLVLQSLARRLHEIEVATDLPHAAGDLCRAVMAQLHAESVDTERKLQWPDLLLAHQGQLWTYDEGIPIAVEEHYHAIGSAAPVALGAMWPVPDRDPDSRVRTALDACARHCPDSVGAPFFVETV